MTNQALIRDFKIGCLKGDYKITIDTSLLPGKWFYFWNKKRKIILDLFNRGAVLAGSRALHMTKINGKRVFNRQPNDWDFLMTQDDFLKFCKYIQYYPNDLTKSQYHLNKPFATFYDGYGGESHWFKCNIQIIIKDELPSFIEVDGKKFATPESIIDSKVELVNTITGGLQSKHQRDLNNLMINIYS
jgi:hypothetical protein